MRGSIFSSSLRSFCVSFFAVIGFFSAIIPAFIILGGATSSSFPTSKTDTIYTPEIIANADGTRKSLSKTAPIILKLNILGVIGTDSLNMNTFRTQLIESREGIFEENPIQAILLHIQSPGGTVVDADGIYRLIKNYKKEYNIPVYAYVDGLCASGGMYIAAAADKIYASDVSLIGSIGVISPPIFNFSKTMDKLGIEALTLSAGIGKDELNSFRPWGTDEGDSYRNIIKTYYEHFVHVMTSNRPELDKQKLIEVYGANIFSAKEAKDCGFIDGAGFNYEDVLKIMSHVINVQDNKYQVIQLDKKNWMTELFSSYSPLLKGQVHHTFDFGSNLSPEIMNQFLYLYRP